MARRTVVAKTGTAVNPVQHIKRPEGEGTMCGIPASMMRKASGDETLRALCQVCEAATRRAARRGER